MSPPTYPFVQCPKCHVQASTERCPACGTPLHNLGLGSWADGSWACLRTTAGQAVPLLGVALGGEVFGAHARLVLRQRYKNSEPDPIEAVYTFPIPSDATLVGFAMECDGRRIEAEVKEREEAFAKYDEAIAKGHGAALLEQERPNIFTASVGNLLPNEETIVEVTFLLRLTADEGALRLMIPTLVAPRYIPGKPQGDRTGHGSSAPTDVVPDADRITPKIAAVQYGLAMDLLFDLGRDVTIESPSHQVIVEDLGGLRKRVTFAAREVALDRDIILNAEGAAGVAAGLVCDKSSGEEGTFALTLVPDLFEAKKRSGGRAVVFVVDVSGSMGGASIEQAKRAMHLCLRHLSEGDLFDILPFSSSYTHFSMSASGRRGGSPDLIPFTQMTLQHADAYVESLQAGGGTEMLQPLTAATSLLAGARRDKVIVLLTDGEVGNEQQILDEVTKRASGVRVYTFGIGTNVSDNLLKGLAKRTKGAAEFIYPGERIDEKVTAQFARATAARVDNVTLKWIGVDAGEVAPSDAPALVDGEPWSVYGRYEQAGMGRVEIRGTLGGENFFMEVPLDFPANVSRPTLTSLWAGTRVKDLEAMDTSAMGRRAEAHKKRIVDLCVRFGIGSKYASFVVVEKRFGDRRSQGMPETRAVPVNAPAGWSMERVRGEGAGGRNVNMTRAGTVRASMAMPMGRSTQPITGAPPMPRSPAPMPGAPMRSPAPMAPPPPPMASGGFGPPPAYGAPPAAAPMGPPPAFGPPPAAPGGYAPPPPPGVAQGAFGSAPPASESKSKGGGGFFERAKKAFGLAKDSAPPAAASMDFLEEEAAELGALESDDEAAPVARSEAIPKAAKPAAPAKKEMAAAPQKPVDLGATFAAQLASGLWESGDSSDRGLLGATAAILERCAKEGVDSSNPIYGAQITKAVDALCALAEAAANRGEDDTLVIRALIAMVAVSTGKRARGRVAAIAAHAKSEAVKAAAPHLVSQEAAKKKIA